MSNPKRIAIVGPECTGKTSLAVALAQHFQTSWVPEFARQYLDTLHRPYIQADLLEIAKGQLELEDEQAQRANKFLICDTSLLVIKIWSEFKYGTCDQQIIDLMNQRTYDLIVLTYIDVPWEFDPQREHPDQREELYAIYETELKQQKVEYTIISGNQETRLRKAVQSVNKLF